MPNGIAAVPVASTCLGAAVLYRTLPRGRFVKRLAVRLGFIPPFQPGLPFCIVFPTPFLPRFLFHAFLYYRSKQYHCSNSFRQGPTNKGRRSPAPRISALVALIRYNGKQKSATYPISVPVPVHMDFQPQLSYELRFSAESWDGEGSSNGWPFAWASSRRFSQASHSAFFSRRPSCRAFSSMRFFIIGANNTIALTPSSEITMSRARPMDPLATSASVDTQLSVCHVFKYSHWNRDNPTKQKT